MDPQETMRLIIASAEKGDTETFRYLAEELAQWIEKGGFFNGAEFNIQNREN